MFNNIDLKLYFGYLQVASNQITFYVVNNY